MQLEASQDAANVAEAERDRIREQASSQHQANQELLERLLGEQRKTFEEEKGEIRAEWTAAPRRVDPPERPLDRASGPRVESSRPLKLSHSPLPIGRLARCTGRLDLRERSTRPPRARESPSSRVRGALSARPIEGERRTVRPRAAGVFD